MWKILENVGPSGLFITLPDLYSTKEAALSAARRMKGTFRVQAFEKGGWNTGPVPIEGLWENVSAA